MKVLLTGFDPFGGETINPSWEVVKHVPQGEMAGISIVTRQLPTIFDQAIEEAISVITKNKPDLVISVGQAGGRASISMERVALNINDAGIPDNQNNQPIDTPIIIGAPAAYFSTLPIKAMVEGIKKAGIPANISNTAGTFVCNHTMYGILHYITQQQLPIKAGFIHIPYLPEQAVQHRGAPSMNLSDMVTALRIAIKIAVQDKYGTAPIRS